MIKNYYWAVAVAAAFVAGTIATATPVFAPPPGDDDDGEGGWKAAIEEQQGQIEEQQGQIEEQQGQIDELKANEILGFYGIEEKHTVVDGEQSGAVQIEKSCDDGDVAMSAMFASGFGDAIIEDVLISVFDEKLMAANFENLSVGELLALHGVCADYDPVHTP